jgi:hypothetical protein
MPSRTLRTTLGNANVGMPKGNFDGPSRAYTINANDQLLSLSADALYLFYKLFRVFVRTFMLVLWGQTGDGSSRRKRGQIWFSGSGPAATLARESLPFQLRAPGVMTLGCLQGWQPLLSERGDEFAPSKANAHLALRAGQWIKPEGRVNRRSATGADRGSPARRPRGGPRKPGRAF